MQFQGKKVLVTGAGHGIGLAMARMVHWGRMCRPEDVAKVVLLASDPAADYLTGQVIPVDGGLSAGRYGIPTS